MSKLLFALLLTASSLLFACNNPSEAQIRREVTEQITFANSRIPKMCYAPIVFYHTITDEDFRIVDAAAKAQGWTALTPSSERFITIVNASDEVHCLRQKT